MKKVLFVASVSGHITAFHIPFLKMFKEKGYTTEVAASGEKDIPFCDIRHEVGFERKPLKLRNITAYRELKKIIKNGNYDVIHCHTPVAAMMTRLIARKTRKKGTKVIYTAHGFHFFKGAPAVNWLVYYPIEKICSLFTDVLITINKEDFEFAKKHMKAARIEYVPGVGINVEKFCLQNFDRTEKRKNLGIGDDDIMMLSVGELSTRKNHEIAIRALAEINDSRLHYMVAGKGGKKEYLEELASQLQISSQVHLLGYRTDVNEICNAADIFCFPSLQEGLPVALMESMATGLACAASDIRGNNDLVENGKGGYLFPARDYKKAAEAIRTLMENVNLRKEMGERNQKAILPYRLENVSRQMYDIYFG